MRIRILVFGVLKEIISESSATLELPEGSRVGDLLAHYREKWPGRDALWESLAAAVNREYVNREFALHENDEVALLPPVSGGNPEKTALVRDAIDAGKIVAELKRGEDGAVCVFDGIVRNHTRGRKTHYLEYEAYEEMALEQMRTLAERALADFAIRDISIVHRLGRLEVGETSVLIVVASAHRGAAFDACRWVIDTLKKAVPIWKKEFFEDGAVWAQGEPWPHPEDLTPRSRT